MDLIAGLIKTMNTRFLLLIFFCFVSSFCAEKNWYAGGNLNIRFNSSVNFNFDTSDILRMSAHIPGFKTESSENCTSHLYIDHIYQDSDVELEVSSEKINDFIHFLYGACRKKWLEDKLFPVHASCIGNDQSGYILLVGPSGSGKTSITLNSLLHNFKLFSGDKTLVRFEHEDMVAVSGTTTITVLKNDISRWSMISKQQESSLGDRIIFRLPDSYYAVDKSVKIKKIFFVKLNDNQFEVNKVDASSAMHKLYPIFLDRSREDIILGKHIFYGTVQNATKLHLIHNLELALEKIDVFDITGSSDEITKFLEHNFCKKSEREFIKKKILFGICGIGNGHCNRQLPIVSTLADQGHEIIIFTYGSGVSFFESRFYNYQNVTVISVGNPYFVGTANGLDFGKTAVLDKNKLDFNRINLLAMDKVAHVFGKPDLVISDYEMVSAQYAYSKQAQLLTLDQQSKYLVGNFEKNLNGTSYVDEIERLNLFFPTANKRIAISFFKVPKKNGLNVEILPPIIKPEVLSAKNFPLSTEPSILLYVTSQQLVDLPIDDWLAVIKSVLRKDFKIHCFLPTQIGLPENDANIHFYHHGDKRFNEIMFASHGIISTAGHTLLSEAMYLEKPVYAIPLPLYEQQLNAYIIDQYGFGVSRPNLTESELIKFINNLGFYRNNIISDKSILFKESGNKIILEKINYMLNL